MSVLGLSKEQKQIRQELKSGVRYVDLGPDKEGNPRVEKRPAGLCYIKGEEVLYKDLTPVQRKKLRKERAKRRSQLGTRLLEKVLKLQAELHGVELEIKVFSRNCKQSELEYLCRRRRDKLAILEKEAVSRLKRHQDRLIGG